MNAGQSAHRSVLYDEAIEGLAIQADGIYVDATFGRGGHSRAVLDKLSDKGRLYAFDRDQAAIDYAAEHFADSRFHIFHHPFSQMEHCLQSQDLLGKVDGLLMDIGVSSPQLDQAERGFSFMKDGPLDMRMDQSKGKSAADWLNEADVEDITWVLRTYGEEKFAWRIANAIIQQRETHPLSRTLELVKVIEAAVPVKDKHKHPATRSFQAIRIYINSELEELETALQSSGRILKVGGRLAIICFHSLEDRLVKRFLKDKSQGKKVPSRVPLLQSEIDASKEYKLHGKATKASQQEIQDNPRARSAVLRVAEKL